MIEGESGILACSDPKTRPIWKPGNKQLIWPNGSIAEVFSAEKPDRMRGPQFHFVWADELAAWRFLQDTWEQIGFATRLGKAEGIHPQVWITTTPRALTFLKELCKDPRTHVTTGSTFDNARNLADSTLRKLKKLIGTSLADQELFGKILDLSAGALWRMSQIEALWLRKMPCKVKRAIVSIDIAKETTERSDETAILVLFEGVDGRLYLVEEHIDQYSPAEWTSIALQRAAAFNAEIVIENNAGGQLAIMALSAAAKDFTWKPTVYACKAVAEKMVRAKVASVVYAQGSVLHIGSHPKTEEEMCDCVPGIKPTKSPNGLDALSMAVIHVFDLLNGLDDQFAIITRKPVEL